jgi:hypothetical protein
VSASLALENLLVSQERLAEAEFDYLQSQLTYNLSQMNLKRATGLLLRTEGVQIGETIECDLPRHVISKTSNTAAVAPVAVQESEIVVESQAAAMDSTAIAPPIPSVVEPATESPGDSVIELVKPNTSDYYAPAK